MDKDKVISLSSESFYQQRLDAYMQRMEKKFMTSDAVTLKNWNEVRAEYGLSPLESLGNLPKRGN
jgi:hypothetical protein